MRIGGEERLIASEDAGLYRDALRRGARPAGCPRPSSSRSRSRSPRLVRRYARTHGPFTTGELAARYGGRPRAGAARARARRRPRARRAAPGRQPSASGATPTCCAACGARRSPRCARRSSPPSRSALARFLPAWQGVDSAPPGGAGVDRLREVLVPLQGRRAHAGGLGARRAAAPRRRLLARRGSTSSAPAARSSGSAPGALGRSSGRVALYFREDVRWLGPPPYKGEPPAEPLHDAIRERLAGGAAFWTDLLADVGRWTAERRAGRAPGGALGPRLGGRGDERRVGAAARPAADARAAQAERAGRRFARRRRPGAPAGPGPLVAHRAAVRRRRPRTARACAPSAELLLERYGIVTRETVLAEGDPRRLLGPLRRADEPRDARHGAARLLRRGPRRRAVRARRRRSSGCAACAPTSRPARSCWPRPTRPTRTAPRCRGRKRDEDRAPAPGARARRLRRACSTPSRCSTSSAAARASSRCATRWTDGSAARLAARGARGARRARPPRAR